MRGRITSQTTMLSLVSPEQLLWRLWRGNGNGSTSPTAGSYSYQSGTSIKVTATPASGYVFTGWSGAASGTANPVSITMDGNKTLTAAFNSGGGTTGPCDIYAAGNTPCSESPSPRARAPSRR